MLFPHADRTLPTNASHSSLRPAAALTILLGAIVVPASAIDTSDTLMLRAPSISENRIAFIYDQDVWVANRERGALGKSV